MICKISRDANIYIAGWLSRQPEVKEESLTDWLLDYFDQNTNKIRYYQFNRLEEARFSGADWDWWILLKKGCFKLRVQAKRIKRGSNHYNDLARSNQHGYQIDILLDSSSRFNFYPIYAVYGLSEGVERCSRPPKPICLHVCSAMEIYDLIFNQPRHIVNSDEILKLTIPLECLFCCPLVHDGPVPGLSNLFDHYFKIHPKNENNLSLKGEKDENRGYEKETPEIIMELFKIEEINNNNAGILKEYQSIYSGSNSLSIIDLRNTKEFFK